MPYANDNLTTSRDGTVHSMPLSLVKSYPVGNAIQIIFRPVLGASKSRLLRKQGFAAAAWNDPSATLIHEGTGPVVIDTDGIVNGDTYIYRLFSLVRGDWVEDGSSLNGTAECLFDDESADVLTIIRDRLFLGFASLISNGVLTPDSGAISVLTAPPIVPEVQMPVVTVHVRSDSSDEFGIGDEFLADSRMEDGSWVEYPGFLSRYSIEIVCWSLNPDERIQMRQLIKALLLSNFSIFDNYGIVEINMSHSDSEDFESYSSPVYQVVTTLSCLAPALIAGYVSQVSKVEMIPNCSETAYEIEVTDG
mgnify:FL=1